MTSKRPGLGVGMILLASVLFAVNGTVSKLVMRAGFDPPQLSFLRAAGAFLGLLILSIAIRPGAVRLRASRREVPLLLLYGVSGFFLVPMLYFVAISRLPVGIGLLFEYTAPLLVALWARFGQKQQVRPRLWIGLAISLAGLACVAEIWGELRLDGLGVAAGLGAAVILALYYVLSAHGVERRDTLSLTTWAFGAAAVAGLLVRGVTAGAGGWEPFTHSENGIPVWLLCCYVVLLGSIAPYMLIAASLRHLPATSAGLIGMVEPVLAAAVAWLTFGASEALNTAQLAGGALVLAGVTLAETARVGRRVAEPTPPDVLMTVGDRPG